MQHLQWSSRKWLITAVINMKLLYIKIHFRPTSYSQETESTMNTTKISSHSVSRVCQHDPTKNIKEKLQSQCSMVICPSCQIHEYIIPSAQYREIIMSGKNGSRSPKMMGCKNCPHISTTINPNK